MSFSTFVLDIWLFSCDLILFLFLEFCFFFPCCICLNHIHIPIWQVYVSCYMQISNFEFLCADREYNFRNLREMFKLDAAEYMMSICGDDGLRELSSPGKSGSLFYLSHDDRFVIKTLKKSELKVWTHANFYAKSHIYMCVCICM